MSGIVNRFTKYIRHFGAEIRLIKMGCKNRPFYHVGVLPAPKPEERYPDEILGSYDPMLNERNEKLLSIDLNRLAFWIGEGAKPTEEVSHLLGMIGFLPVDPLTYQTARECRRKAAEEAAAKAAEQANGEPTNGTKSDSTGEEQS